MFEQSLNNLQSGHSLGDTKVVGKLVGQFVNDVVTSSSLNGLIGTVNRMADIFAGLDGTYQPVDEWNDGRHLGRLLARRLSVSDQQASIDIFRSAFGVFAREAMELVKAGGAKDMAGVRKSVDALKNYMVACLLGTVDTLYPNGKDWK